MKNPVMASKYPYLVSVIFIFNHIHSHTSCFENPLSYMQQWITFSAIECEIQHLCSSSMDVLSVIYSYQLLILVKNIFYQCFIHMVGTLVVIVVNIYVVTCKIFLECTIYTTIFQLYRWYIFNIKLVRVHFQSHQKLL